MCARVVVVAAANDDDEGCGFVKFDKCAYIVFLSHPSEFRANAAVHSEFLAVCLQVDKSQMHCGRLRCTFALREKVPQMKPPKPKLDPKASTSPITALVPPAAPAPEKKPEVQRLFLEGNVLAQLIVIFKHCLFIYQLVAS